MPTTMTTNPANPANPAQRADHYCLHILVVEDNLDSQQLVCELLVTLGHRAMGVSTGEQALAELESQAFDMLFTDVSLPGISGIELAKRVGQTQPSLRIVFASGFGAQLGKNLGADAILLPKPYDMDQLQHILTRVMRERQAS